MPHEAAVLQDVIGVYTVALVLILTLGRLGMPSLVALIAAGAIAGPAGIRIVSTEQEVEALAEIGIVLLLFTVGLEFSLGEIRRIWKQVLVSGVLQIVLTAVAVGSLLLFGQSDLRLAIFVGLFAALSSTAIVLKELAERNQVNTPHGRLMVGILLFQDLAIVVLLILVPLLSGRETIMAVPGLLAKAGLALLVVAVVSRIVLPPLFRLAMRSRREAFSLLVLLASVGTAWLSSLLGISMALGAFLGGLVLADNEFSHQVHAEIRPLRDLLAGLFFISIGLLADPALIVRQLPAIAVASVVIIAVKTIATVGAAAAVAVPLRIAVTAAIGIAQVGEFSFVLARAGLEAGLISSNLWQVLLASSIVTMLATPSLIAFAPNIGFWTATRLVKRREDRQPDGMPEFTDHVVILGYGHGGRLIAGALRDLDVPYLILELNGATVSRERARGEPIFYADATSPDALHAAGVGRARAVAVVLSDPNASMRAISAIRAQSRTVPAIVRTRYRLEAERAERLGATFAVAEEAEASLELLAHLLTRLDMPGNLIEILLDGFRRASGRAVRAPTAPLDSVPDEIRHIPIATHKLSQQDWAAGKTLAEVNLRAETGASVLAVRRDGKSITAPQADFMLKPADVLYLLGDESDILLARKHLQESDGGAAVGPAT